MSYQNIILLIAAGVNLLMSILVFARGVRNNKINLYFSLLTFFNFLWAACLYVLYMFISESITIFFTSVVYPIGIIIVVMLYMFILHFPYQIKKLRKVIKLFFLVSILWTSIFCTLFFNNFVLGVDINPVVVSHFAYIPYTIFFVNFLLLMLLVINILLLKIHLSEGMAKFQLKLLFFGVFIGLIVGFSFNLLFFYFGKIDMYYYMGPLFTLVINFVAFYLIYLSDFKLNKSNRI